MTWFQIIQEHYKNFWTRFSFPKRWQIDRAWIKRVSFQELLLREKQDPSFSRETWTFPDNVLTCRVLWAWIPASFPTEASGKGGNFCRDFVVEWHLPETRATRALPSDWPEARTALTMAKPSGRSLWNVFSEHPDPLGQPSPSCDFPPLPAMFSHGPQPPSAGLGLLAPL